MDLREQLIKEYPSSWFYGQRRFFGFECGNGWLQIIKELFDDLLPLTKNNPDFRILQVKEKFGDLRVYVANSNDEIDKAIGLAEAKSVETCDRCGDKGIKRYEGWIVVRCDAHAKE